MHTASTVSLSFVFETLCLICDQALWRGLLKTPRFEHDLLRERVKADIAHTKKLSKPHRRPQTAKRHKSQATALFQQGMSKSKIAKELILAVLLSGAC